MTSAPAAASDRIRVALGGFEPTPEQWEAISHPEGPCHLIAGAGSGKTAVMAARIVWLVEERGYRPGQILGLTFTNKAAEELEQRVRSALAAGDGAPTEEVRVETYNAFAASIVRERGLLVGVDPDSGLLTEAQRWQVVLSALDDLPPFEDLEVRTSGAVARAALKLADAIGDHVVSTADVMAVDERTMSLQGISGEARRAAARRRELCRVVDAYVAAKRRHKRFDFNDQVLKAVQVLEDHEDAARAYAERYPVVLLDEYQDTNVAQRRMLQALTRFGRSVTAVGDTRQAIYGWRGATMYNLIDFPRHFRRPGEDARPAISLSRNFRSGRRILDAANAIAERIDPERRPGRPLVAHPANGEGHVAVGTFTDERAEADFVAAEIARLHGQPTAPGRPPVRWRDVAVLVRRRSSMDVLREALAQRGIPVEVVGLGGLLRTPEVNEVVAWLRALEPRPGSNRWLGRLLLGPRWRIHYRDLALCARWAAERNHELRLRLAGGDPEAARDLEPGEIGHSLAEALEHLDDIEGLGPVARSRLSDFHARLERLRSRVTGSLLELVEEAIAVSGIRDTLMASPSSTAPAALQNLASFVDHVAAFAPVEGEATLRSFLDYLDAAEEADESLEAAQPAAHDSVKLMTVHSAKGLEFECVFVPAVAAMRKPNGDYVYSVFPDVRTSDPLRSHDTLPHEVREDADHLPRLGRSMSEYQQEVRARAIEDERRLFYVALTRARQRLYVTCAWWYGRGKKHKGPSVFFDELKALVGDGVVEVVAEQPRPESNPAIEALEAARAWPPGGRADTDDPLFPEGFGEAAQRALEDPGVLDALVGSLDPDAMAAYEEALQSWEDDLELIAAARSDGAAGVRLPEVMSVTGYLAYLRGEKGLFELLRPLPERPSAARSAGSAVHRLIEQAARSLPPYPEEAELDAPGPPAEDERVRRLVDSFTRSPYAQRELAQLPSGEVMAELPLALRAPDGRILRGRVDAVFTAPGGSFEVVDFKTGEAHFDPEPGDQLHLYARALRANGLIPEGAPVTLTYLFLSEEGATARSRRWEPEAS